MDYHFRDFSIEKDYDAVIELWNHSGAGLTVGKSDEPNELKKYLDRSPGLFIVAESGRQLIGTVLGGFDGRRAFIYHLAVDQLYQKQGIASAMLHEMENRFKQRGVCRYYLFVKKINDNAIQFYEEQEFEDLNYLRVFAKSL
jgi:ribosomal protein S18 acetylase RimI-like enzyme